MELSISDDKMKKIIKEVLIDIIEEKREVFYDVVLEALEEISLGNAIKKGRKNKFVSEDRILGIIRN